MLILHFYSKTLAIKYSGQKFISADEKVKDLAGGRKKRVRSPEYQSLKVKTEDFTDVFNKLFAVRIRLVKPRTVRRRTRVTALG